MKPVILKNPINGEQVICDDTRDVKVIDGVEYFLVRRHNAPRQFLMRKDALIREPLKK